MLGAHSQSNEKENCVSKAYMTLCKLYLAAVVSLTIIILLCAANVDLVAATEQLYGKQKPNPV